MIRISLSNCARTPVRRRAEPVSVGIPFPKGSTRDLSVLTLSGPQGQVAMQARALDTWSDGSIRWALVDFAADADANAAIASSYELAPRAADTGTHPSEVAAPQRALHVSVPGLEGAAATIETPLAVFRLCANGALEGHARGETAPTVVRMHASGKDDSPWSMRVDSVDVEDHGPLKATVVVRASVLDAAVPMQLVARWQFHASTPVARLQVTLRNPSRAVHEGGFWDLGDPGSRLIRDLSCTVSMPAGGQDPEVWCSPDTATPLTRYSLPLELYQDSSGGENWQCSTHLDRERHLPVRFRGYRLRSGQDETRGLRATPVVVLRSGTRRTAVALRQFWQRFPKAFDVAAGTLRVGLLPAQSATLHELQGGEQITEEVSFAFGDDPVSEIPLDWTRTPLRGAASPEWYCAAGALPYLTPTASDPNAAYQALVNAAIEGGEAFHVKRERIDEFGWRNFGELYADHETVFHKDPRPLISHYNNQYDAIAGLACQFFRSANLAWFELMDDLARHVVDIDLYHTAEDKAAYNGGLFWHTAHHTDADLATHRTYPRSGAPASGGLSCEHNYNTGLTLHYFMTGDARSRAAAIELADWVIAMDDGGHTPLRWVTRAPTGWASATGSFSYHGPGRGAGNSIVSLLNACRLTGSRRYLDKAEELVRRCVHPEDDLPALELLDAERRWYYTVFLQALSRYLDFKAERREVDAMYAYGRATLLHYARWMADHEYPYLEKPEILQYPTETWAGQDMRKSEVFQQAARYAEPAERARFLERAEFFFTYSVTTLTSMPTRTFTRPIVLMLTNGATRAWFQQHTGTAAPPSAATGDFGAPSRFRSQRDAAIRRLAVIAVVGAASMLAALAAALL